MALVTVSEASKLVRKSSKTIYRHLDTGRLSYSHNENGIKCIDISEIERVYGKIKQKNENVIASQMSGDENKKDTMSEQLLRQENDMLRELLKEKEAHIDSLRKAMVLLEHKPRNESKKKPWWRF